MCVPVPVCAQGLLCVFVCQDVSLGPAHTALPQCTAVAVGRPSAQDTLQQTLRRSEASHGAPLYPSWMWPPEQQAGKPDGHEEAGMTWGLCHTGEVSPPFTGVGT